MCSFISVVASERVIVRSDVGEVTEGEGESALGREEASWNGEESEFVLSKALFVTVTEG